MIIGISGRGGSGKSTVAEHLAARHDFARVRFADPLKHMIRGYLNAIGVGADMIERMIEGDLKEVASPFLGGKTPRKFMQLAGTEFCRDMIGPMFWVDAWKASVAKVGEMGWRNVVAEDVRFPEEAKAIIAKGGIIIHIERQSLERNAGNHSSEQQEIDADFVLDNDGPISALLARVDNIVSLYLDANRLCA